MTTDPSLSATFRKIACIGAGTIGRAWAVAFAAAGRQVHLHDSLEGAAQQALVPIAAAMRDLEDAGLIGSADVALSRIVLADALADAVDEADYVQESIVEDVTAKRSLYARLDGLVPPYCLLGSSTSALKAVDFLCDLSISPRAMVVHPTNPPFLVPLTEVCASPQTAPDNVAAVMGLLRDIGQSPVLLQRDVTGFALNRLQAAVINEALALVASGTMSPQDVDRVITDGLALRWAFMGPFLTGHLNAPGGYADYMARYGAAYRAILDDMGADQRWTKEEFAVVDAAMPALDVRGTAPLQAWRDRRLAALRRHLAAAEPLPDSGGMS